MGCGLLKDALTFSKRHIRSFPKSHGAIGYPELLLGQQEHLGIETELSRYWVTDLWQKKKKL